MKRFCLLWALIFQLNLSTLVFAQQSARFMSLISEMPLMPGLVEVEDTAVIFDGPSGRIIEVMAIGEVHIDAIRSFYATALPQLGWVLLRNGNYRQDAEILQLDFISDPSGSTKAGVRFVLHPLNSNKVGTVR